MTTTSNDAFDRINTLAYFISDCDDQLQFTQLILQQLDGKQLSVIEEAMQDYIASAES